METHYPECEVTLLGTSTNAASIIQTVVRALRRHIMEDLGLSASDARQITNNFTEEATSGDYDNVLITCHRWVSVN